MYQLFSAINHHMSTSNALILHLEGKKNVFFLLTEYSRNTQIQQRRDAPYIAQIKSVWGIAAFVCVWIGITARAWGGRAPRTDMATFCFDTFCVSMQNGEGRR